MTGIQLNVFSDNGNTEAGSNVIGHVFSPIPYTDIAKWRTHRLSNDVKVY